MCAIHENTRLTEVVSVVWCLLLVGPYGMSAPVQPDGFWVDPCGGHAVADSGVGGDRRSDAELLDAIMVTATRALNKAKSFADAYGRETFSKTIEDLDKDFPSRLFPKDKNPKKFGEDAPSEHYRMLMEHGLGKNLLRHYGHLQELAIELSAVVDDQKMYAGNFYKEFRELKQVLKQVLCETLSGITELGYGDQVVNRMGPVGRAPITDETFRIVRDFRVLREYILYMEYLVQGIEFFKDNLE